MAERAGVALGRPRVLSLPEVERAARALGRLVPRAAVAAQPQELPARIDRRHRAQAGDHQRPPRAGGQDRERPDPARLPAHEQVPQGPPAARVDPQQVDLTVAVPGHERQDRDLAHDHRAGGHVGRQLQPALALELGQAAPPQEVPGVAVERGQAALAGQGAQDHAAGQDRAAQPAGRDERVGAGAERGPPAQLARAQIDRQGVAAVVGVDGGHVGLGDRPGGRVALLGADLEVAHHLPHPGHLVAAGGLVGRRTARGRDAGGQLAAALALRERLQRLAGLARTPRQAEEQGPGRGQPRLLLGGQRAREELLHVHERGAGLPALGVDVDQGPPAERGRVGGRVQGQDRLQGGRVGPGDPFDQQPARGLGVEVVVDGAGRGGEREQAAAGLGAGRPGRVAREERPPAPAEQGVEPAHHPVPFALGRQLIEALELGRDLVVHREDQPVLPASRAGGRSQEERAGQERAGDRAGTGHVAAAPLGPSDVTPACGGMSRGQDPPRARSSGWGAGRSIVLTRWLSRRPGWA